LGVIKEQVEYPKNWEEFVKLKGWYNNSFDVQNCNPTVFMDYDERIAIRVLGKLIVLRNWWWDNMCDGWRPDWTNGKTKYVFYLNLENNFSSTWLNS